MAERRATNKYYPPQWDPKHGSINKFVGQHPLRERARKLDQGILVVRFEMPYNVYCDNCHNHIAKGRRYNAEKKSVGKYFTTTIWNFSMKCHHCSAKIQVQTDPQNRDYALIGTHRVLAEDGKLEENAGNVYDDEDEQKNEMRNDPFKRLEHLQEDQEFADEEKGHLIQLQEMRDRLSANDYDRNTILRKNFRDKKASLEKQKKDGLTIGLAVPLLPSTQQDTNEAKDIKFSTKTINYVQHKVKERMKIHFASIFSNRLTSNINQLRKEDEDTNTDKAPQPNNDSKESQQAKKENIKRMAFEKCLKEGLDFKIFGVGAPHKSTSSIQTLKKGKSALLKVPIKVDFKKK